MNWQPGQIKINTNLHYPKDENYQDKYLIGLSLLLKHKESLLQDPCYQSFIHAYEKIIPHTMLDYDRAFMLYQAALSTKHLVGCTAECGVYKGGSSALIASLSPDKTHYALDTYEGMPDNIAPIDSHTHGDLAPDNHENINQLFKKHANIYKLKGQFKHSFNEIKDTIFSFVYVDADLYQSTFECCEFFYPRLTFGGIMLFDDYLLDTTRGVKKAVDEFFQNQRTRPFVLPTNQAIVYHL